MDEIIRLVDNPDLFKIALAEIGSNTDREQLLLLPYWAKRGNFIGKK